jgi:hypothetical protein
MVSRLPGQSSTPVRQQNSATKLPGNKTPSGNKTPRQQNSQAAKLRQETKLHSIFVDEAPASFPQMDVWPRCYCVGNAFDRRQFRTKASKSSGVSYPAKSGEISAFP